MVDVTQCPAKKFLEDTRRALIAGLARIDRDQVVHRHHEPGAGPPFKGQNAMKVIALDPSRAQQTDNRAATVVEHTNAVKFPRAWQHAVAGFLGGK